MRISISIAIDIYIYIYVYVHSYICMYEAHHEIGAPPEPYHDPTLSFARESAETLVRSKQRDPNPKDNALMGKDTSTHKGFHSTFAALFSY